MKNIKNLIIIVDMQNDFISGVLGSDDAQKARDNIIEFLKNQNADDSYVLFIRDTHSTNKEEYLQTDEGKYCPIHHCALDSEGFQIDQKIIEMIRYKKFYCYAILKQAFMLHTYDKDFEVGQWDIYHFLTKWQNTLEKIYIFGLHTDTSVISSALYIKRYIQLGGYNHNVDLICLKDLCAGTTKENHEAALKVMKSCQMEVE